MDRTWCARIIRASLAVLVVHFVSATPLAAQAEVPGKGEGTVSIAYQNYYHTGHFDLAGKKTTNGSTHSKAVVTEIDYGVTDTVGVTVSLPFITSKYTGPRPSYFVAGIETFPGPLDDGLYHGAFQDVRVEVRRVFPKGLIDVAPFVGVAFPTHDYKTQGEAVPGRHRRELQLGASASASLDSVLPRADVHVRYAYAALERVRGFPHTRSNIDLEGSDAVTSRVALRGLVSWQIRHKGPKPLDLRDDWENHDRFINSSYLNVGGGVSVSMTRSADVYAVWVAAVSGKSGAHIARALAVGASWRFGGGFGGFGADANSLHRASPNTRPVPPSKVH